MGGEDLWEVRTYGEIWGGRGCGDAPWGVGAVRQTRMTCGPMSA